MTKEILAVPRLDIDLGLMILPVFGFLAYEIPTYDFEANVVPLRSLVDRALSMDRTSPYWDPLVCFCILSQYLLLRGITAMAAFAETFIWLGDHAWDSSSVLGPMWSLLLPLLWAFEKLQVIDPPSDHLMFDYRPRVYFRSHCRLTRDTVNEWTTIFQDLTAEGVRWTCPWWYIE
ncbi:hypothetical protein JCGZ_26506 [Jatropha curcas]|uniref:Uncharacterized protein n=1 Tax=Jatropha curcas TaxID=180498 RepID=A0A067JXG1_JATCU|nr:hypothetical protein JCGZ_26506 [Jatropha curcas]